MLSIEHGLTVVDMKKNIIILTVGLSGSSLLTSLLAIEGYWSGDNTAKKKDYDTHENSGLVNLNRGLIRLADKDFDYTMDFSGDIFNKLEKIDFVHYESKFRDFLEHCNDHRPWIWKDPRLWMTIRFWDKIIDNNEVQFIVLTRNNFQAWVSQLNRRQIQTYQHLKKYNKDIEDSIVNFLEESGKDYIKLEYEDLIMRPEQSIDSLNTFLATNIGLESLAKLYRGKLHKMPKGMLDTLMGLAIYAKNYLSRVK